MILHPCKRGYGGSAIHSKMAALSSRDAGCIPEADLGTCKDHQGPKDQLHSEKCQHHRPGPDKPCSANTWTSTGTWTSERYQHSRGCPDKPLSASAWTSSCPSTWSFEPKPKPGQACKQQRFDGAVPAKERQLGWAGLQHVLSRSSGQRQHSRHSGTSCSQPRLLLLLLLRQSTKHMQLLQEVHYFAHPPEHAGDSGQL